MEEESVINDEGGSKIELSLQRYAKIWEYRCQCGLVHTRNSQDISGQHLMRSIFEPASFDRFEIRLEENI